MGAGREVWRWTGTRSLGKPGLAIDVEMIGAFHGLVGNSRLIQESWGFRVEKKKRNDTAD